MTKRNSEPDSLVIAEAIPRAKRLPGLPVAHPASIPDLVPARMINEVLYCERLMYLEWAQGEFADNFYTVDGRVAHRRADKPGRPMPAPAKPAVERDDEASEPVTEEPAPWTARSVWLSSERLGMTAKIDVVESTENGKVVPVEYKRGSRPDVPEGAWLPERAQVCAQVLLLRDHGYECDEAWIWYAKDRRKVVIEITQDLIEVTHDAAARAKELTRRGVLPAPLTDSPKCIGCSLSGICLPDEVQLLRNYAELRGDLPPEAEPAPEPNPESEPEDEVFGRLDPDPWDLAGAEIESPLRRLHPARDDKQPLYVQDAGGRIALSGDRLVVHSRGGAKTEARLPNTSQVCILGNIQLSTQALRALLERGIPVSFFSMGGYFLGRATGHNSNNVELRIAQHAAAADPTTCLQLARGWVASKILNTRTLLRRNHDAPDPTVLGELRRLSRKAREAMSLPSLLGVEGTAARVYFGQFSGMLKGTDVEVFDFEGRNRRPPKDPINALLSLSYSLLSKDVTLALHAVGLDPLLGFYHQPRFGRPALALDLMEEFRPIIADSTVISAINNGVVTGHDFAISPAGCSLHSPGRRRFIQAYERRMDQLVTHPVFGYRISYRRVLEVQARLLGRHLLGEIESYPEFRTR